MVSQPSVLQKCLQEHRTVGWQFDYLHIMLTMHMLAWIVGTTYTNFIMCNPICGWSEGLCQLCIYKMQLTKAYVAEASCISCYIFCYLSAPDQFDRYQQHSSEPLRHHLCTYFVSVQTNMMRKSIQRYPTHVQLQPKQVSTYVVR